MKRRFCVYCENCVPQNVVLVRIKKCFLRKYRRNKKIYCCAVCYSYHDARVRWAKHQKIVKNEKSVYTISNGQVQADFIAHKAY